MFEFIVVVKLSGGIRLYEVLATDKQQAETKIKNKRIGLFLVNYHNITNVFLKVKNLKT